MVLSVLEAVGASRYQPAIFVSSNDPEVIGLNKIFPFQTLPSEARAVESLLRSLERLPGDGPVLFISGDHPLLTTEMIDYFVSEVLARKLAFGVAAINRNRVRQEYPESQRTYFPVKGGAYSGGNLFLVDRRQFQADAAILEMIDQNRKRPWKSLPILGLKTIAEVLFRRIDIHEVARRTSRLIGCETGIVDMPFAECCMDVDKPSDRLLAERILNARKAQLEREAGEPKPYLSLPLSSRP